MLDNNYAKGKILEKLKKTFFVVYPRQNGDTWGVEAVRKDFRSFKNKKDFPKAWAGLRDKNLQKVSGVSDAVFCHRGLFLAVAKSKEGAIKLAQLALKN